MSRRQLLPKKVAVVLPHEVVGVFSEASNLDILYQHSALDGANEAKNTHVKGALASTFCVHIPVGGWCALLMGQELSLDGQIRANRFADPRDSPDSHESLEGSRTEPLFLRIAFWWSKSCESQV